MERRQGILFPTVRSGASTVRRAVGLGHFDRPGQDVYGWGGVPAASDASRSAGASVEAEWQAVDGDESREPRHGRGVITLDAEGVQLTIALRRADAAQTDERALTLRGAIDASALRGTFSDRLFAFRAGTFEGVVVP